MKYRFTESLPANISSLFMLIMALSFNALAADVCDIDGNNQVNQNDIDLIFQARNSVLTTPFDPRDIDRNGVINTNDARLCVCALPTTADCSAPLNQAPIANPGPDQSLSQGNFSVVNLDGSASSDPDGDSLNFLWSLQQRPEGSQAVLVNQNTSSPSFTPDRTGVYIVSLTVTDGFGASSSDTVTIDIVPVVSNQSPVARDDFATAAVGGDVINGNVLGNDSPGDQPTQAVPMSITTTPNGGSFSLLTNGDYSYTPPTSVTTTVQEQFSYTITDADGETSTATLTVTVSPSVTGLKAEPDINTAIIGGATVTGRVLDNDNVTNLPARVTLSSQSRQSRGTIILNNDGSYSYTPPSSARSGFIDQFLYILTDRAGNIATSTLNITVELPSVLAQPDEALAIASGPAIAGNVLSNDIVGNLPVNVAPIVMNMVTGNGGLFSLQNNGSYTYMPPVSLDTMIQEVFDYTVTDSDGVESRSTLTITVSPENRVPVARPDPDITNPDSANVVAGGAVISGNVLSNDDQGNQPTVLTPIQTNLSTALGGIFSLQADGSYTYMPPQSVNTVEVETFEYTITDSDGESSTSMLTITVNPRLPLDARPDSDNATAGGVAIVGNVLANDDLGSQPTQLSGTVTNLMTQQGGEFTLLTDGSYSYMPPVAVNGVVSEVFEYTLTDSNGTSDTATLTIMVQPAKPPLIARPDANTVEAGDSGITGNVLVNDDRGNEPTLVTTPMNITTTQNGGRFNLGADGSYSYIPPTSVTGVVTDMFTYQIQDSDGETDESTLTITVTPMIPDLVCRPDLDTVTIGGAGSSPPQPEVATGNVLGNDVLGNEPTRVTPILVDRTDIGGSFMLGDDGSYAYSPPLNLSEVMTETFTYEATDSDAQTCTSTLTITVNPRNLIPFARPDSNSVKARPGSDGVQGNVLDNDRLGDIPTVVLNPTSNGITTDKQGLFNLDQDGSYLYIPPEFLSGVITETFSYNLIDVDGDLSNQSTVTITVTPSCSAQDDANKIMAGGSSATPGANTGPQFTPNSVSGNVLDNDMFCSSPITVTPIAISATGIGGSFSLQSDGSYTYKAPGFLTSQQSEIFTYTITDAEGDSSTAALVITVKPELRAVEDFNSGSFPDDITGNVLTNDAKGNQPTSATPITSIVNGCSFTLLSDGRYTFKTSKPESGGPFLKSGGPFLTFVPPVKCFEFSSNATTSASTISEAVSIPYTITDSDGETSSSDIIITYSEQVIF